MNRKLMALCAEFGGWSLQPNSRSSLALQKTASGTLYAYITRLDDPDAPEDVDEPCVLQYCAADGSDRPIVQFRFDSVRQALEVAARFFS